MLIEIFFLLEENSLEKATVVVHYVGVLINKNLGYTAQKSS